MNQIHYTIKQTRIKTLIKTRIKTRTNADLPRHMRSTAKKLTEQLHLLLTERVK